MLFSATALAALELTSLVFSQVSFPASATFSVMLVDDLFYSVYSGADVVFSVLLD
ncbi:MAG: hypothetical protein KZQ71_15045 [Candidatus Thiodiazotropha sp. (ex Lucinoma aequizonata)]|nr:hypothetical protein [Candidatus Thiodiazotropha sp. (ex Lucinoma aequizonata)]MCU7909762.1 hypothetical protein [Candidatus Thiodiazotropha sp. (ex Lucinoma aequizonata)]